MEDAAPDLYADLLKQINETHRAVIITQRGEPKVVCKTLKVMRMCGMPWEY
jgi:hypothetical protein